MKTALIIGASGDIGQAIANSLAKEGWSLYLHGFQHAAQCDQMAETLHQQYPQQDFFSLRYDLTDSKHLSQLVDQLFAVDAVVFAAGMTFYGLFETATVQQLDALWAVHVKTPMQICQALQDKLARSQHGRIVFIGSIYGGSGSAMEVAYSTVKGAQSAFVNAYAKEVGSLGITVNVVAPGAVDTKMNQNFDFEQRQQIAAEIPVARFASTTEIAYWIKALLADDASYLTGQTLYISGGWLK